jgi:hypothetical protein
MDGEYIMDRPVIIAIPQAPNTELPYKLEILLE